MSGAGPINLDDYAALASQALDDNARAYIDGGAGDEHALRANRAAWAGLQLLPRVLRDLSGGHTRVELLGRTLAHPVLLAPVAYQRLAHPDGEAATALAAAAQGAGLVLSAQASVPLERVAGLVRDDAGRGPRAAVVSALPAARPGLHARAGRACRGSGLRGPGLDRGCPGQRRP